MKNTYYKLPINFDSVFDSTGTIMPMCNEKESIDQNIELLLTTCPGEHQFNKNWGCHIWDMDFELVFFRKKWEDDFTAHIFKAIQNFEQRLKDVTVAISIMEMAHEDIATKSTAIKKKVVVYINGKLVFTNEPCGFIYTIFLGPLST